MRFGETRRMEFTCVREKIAVRLTKPHQPTLQRPYKFRCPSAMPRVRFIIESFRVVQKRKEFHHTIPCTRQFGQFQSVGSHSVKVIYAVNTVPIKPVFLTNGFDKSL